MSVKNIVLKEKITFIYDNRWNFLITPLGMNVYNTLFRIGTGHIDIGEEDVTIKEIRIQCGNISRDKTLTAIKKLEEYGFIDVERRGGGKSNLYLIYNMPKMTEELKMKAKNIEQTYNHKVYKKGNTDNPFAQKAKKVKEKDNKKKTEKARATRAIKNWFNSGYRKWYNMSYSPKNNKNYSEKCNELLDRFKEEFPDTDLKELMNEKIKKYIMWAFLNYKDAAPYITTLYPGNLTDQALLAGWFSQLSNKEVEKKEKQSKKEERREGKTYHVDKGEGDLDEYYIKGIKFIQGDVGDVNGFNTIYGKNSEQCRLNILRELIKQRVIENNDVVWWSELPFLDEIHDLFGVKLDKTKRDVGIEKFANNPLGTKVYRDME